MARTKPVPISIEGLIADFRKAIRDMEARERRSLSAIGQIKVIAQFQMMTDGFHKEVWQRVTDLCEEAMR